MVMEPIQSEAGREKTYEQEAKSQRAVYPHIRSLVSFRVPLADDSKWQGA